MTNLRAAATKTTRTSPPQLAVALQLAGAGLILIGAFVPWVRSQAFFLVIPVRGVETDYGQILPFLALGVYALLAYQWSFGWRRWPAGVVLSIGICAVAVGLFYGVQVQRSAIRLNVETKNQPEAPLVIGGGPLFNVTFDVGYYLSLLGGLGLVVGAIGELQGTRRKLFAQNPEGPSE